MRIHVGSNVVATMIGSLLNEAVVRHVAGLQKSSSLAPASNRLQRKGDLFAAILNMKCGRQGILKQRARQSAAELHNPDTDISFPPTFSVKSTTYSTGRYCSPSVQVCKTLQACQTVG